MSDKNLALNLLIKAKDMASATVRRFQREVDTTATSSEALSEQLDDTSAALDGVEKSSNNAAQHTDELSDALTEADRAAGRYIDANGRLREANGQYAKSADGAADKTDKLNRQMKRNEQQSGKLAVAMGKVQKCFAALLTLEAARRLFMGALDSSRRFERQMNRVGAVTNATTEEMHALKTAAEEAGSTTQYTAEQAGEGLEILARAGFNAETSIKLLPQVLAVATAEGVGLAEAAGLISDTLSVMQLDVSEGAKVTDILAKGSSLANTRMLELGNAISYTGSYAREANIDLPQLVAILDVLAANSLRGERGGTGLRAVLAQLSDPASKASQAIRRLNLPTDNFIELLEGLRQAGPEAKAAINAFGVEAGPALRALIAAGSEGIGEFTEKLNQVEGAAQTMASRATNDMQGAMDSTTSSWDALRKNFSDPLLKPFTGALDLISAKFREMKDAGNFAAWGELAAGGLNRVAGAIQLVYNLATLGTKSIGTFVAQVAVWVTETEVQIARLLNRLGMVNDATVKALEQQAGGVRAVLKAFVDEARQDIADLGDGWDLASGKVTLYEQSQRKAAEAQKANSEQLKQSANQATDAVEQQGEALDNTATALKRATKNIVDQFDKARANGETTARALDAAFAEVSYDHPESLAALSEALKQLKAEGAASAEDLESGLSRALSKLSDTDLTHFREAARQAFSGAGTDAGQLNTLVSAALSENLKRLGVDASAIGDGVSKGTQVAIHQLDSVREALKTTGADAKRSAATFRAAFEQALTQAATTADIDALRESVDAFFKDNLIGARDAGIALDALKGKYQEIKASAQQSLFGQRNALIGIEQGAKKAANSVSDLAQADNHAADAADNHAQANQRVRDSYQRSLSLAGRARDEWAAAGDVMAARFKEISTQLNEDLNPSNMQGFFSGRIGILSYLKGYNSAFKTARASAEQAWREYDKQDQAAQRLEKTLAAGGTEAARMAWSAEVASRSFDKLGSERLEGLNSAIASANAQSKQLTDNLTQTLNSLRDELDRLNGNTSAIQQRGYIKQRNALMAQRDQAIQAGNGEAVSAATQALSLLSQTNDLTLKQLAKQQAQQKAADPPRKTTEVKIEFPNGQRVSGDFDDNQAALMVSQLTELAAVSR